MSNSLVWRKRKCQSHKLAVCPGRRHWNTRKWNRLEVSNTSTKWPCSRVNISLTANSHPKIMFYTWNANGCSDTNELFYGYYSCLWICDPSLWMATNLQAICSDKLLILLAQIALLRPTSAGQHLVLNAMRHITKDYRLTLIRLRHNHIVKAS